MCFTFCVPPRSSIYRCTLANFPVWRQCRYILFHFFVGNFSEQQISLTSQKILLTLEALDIFCNSSLECCCTNNKASNTRSQRQVDVSLFPTTHACTIIRLKNVGHQQHPILWTLVKYLHNVLLKVENGAYKFYKKIFLNHLLSLIHTWVWFCQFCTVDIRAHYCTMVSIFVRYEWLHHLRRPAWPGATYNRVRLEMEPRSWVTISSQSFTTHQTFSSYFGGHFLGLFLYFHANKISDICVDVMIYIFFFLHQELQGKL